MQNEVDPFEEFEFKPITDGLGFHRNQKNLSESRPDSKIESMAIKTQSNLFSTPLPNKKSTTPKLDSYSPQTTLTQSQTQPHDIVDEILKNIETSKQRTTAQFEIPKTQAKVVTSRTEAPFKASSPLLTAMLLDLLLVMASTLLFLVALLAITKIDLLLNIKNPDDQGSVYISLFLLFYSVGFIYYVCFRAFLGYTPGEWAYDQKVQLTGGRLDFLNLTKIALRSILVMVTGGFIIPLISWVFDKDFLGNFLELPLVRKK